MNVHCRPRRRRPLVVPIASERSARAPGGVGPPQQRSPVPGLCGQRPPQLWLSLRPPAVPPAPPPPLGVDREQGVDASGASSPAQTGGPCAHALVPPLRSGSRRGCPVRRTNHVCGGLSNLGRRAGGAPLNVLRAGACGTPSPGEVAPPPTPPDAATPSPWAHLVPGSGAKALWRPSVARLLPNRIPPFASGEAEREDRPDPWRPWRERVDGLTCSTR